MVEVSVIDIVGPKLHLVPKVGEIMDIMVTKIESTMNCIFALALAVTVPLSCWGETMNRGRGDA